jgi:pimeloyl-ACP methyl ester carboxylesterase
MKALLLLLIALPAAAAAGETDLTLPAIPIRSGVTADIHVRVYRSDDPACAGRTVLAVHGVAHSAASWEPFARRALVQGLAGQTVCTFAAFDLPGHGASSLPVGGPKFGNLRLTDDAAVLLGVLQGLRAAAVSADTVIGHSQGGLLVQLAQKALIRNGATFAQLGVTQAILLTSVGPRQIPWEFVDGGTATPLLLRFVRFSRPLGLHVGIPEAQWASVFFLDLAGNVVAPPSLADVARFNAKEPSFSSLQLVGLGLPRLGVPAGAFAPDRGTRLTVIGLENDTIIRPAEQGLLYEHLTGTPAGFDVVTVFGPTTVHDMHVADPDALLAALEE